MPRNPNKIDYSGGFPPFLEAFEILEDPRSGGRTRHHFGEVVFMVFACILCGISKYEKMEEFCEIHEEWFKKWITLPNGIPSYNTFSRIFESIAPDRFADCILSHLSSIGVELQPKQIAIDGKALRGSSNSQDKHIHAVSAWACEEGVTLAQTFVAEKSNEITAIPQLLTMLNIESTVVSIDAMGTQRDIAEAIIEAGGDYLLSVKANQKSLFNELNDHFNFALTQLNRKKLNPKNWSTSETCELSRGREETRKVLVCHSLEWMDKSVREKWKNLGSVIMVYRHSNVENGSQRSQISFYMSSLTNTKANEMQHYIRNHWGIENSCHWVIDVVFEEDSNQVSKRNSAKNLSTVRRIALNAIKQAPEISKRKKPASLTSKQFRAAHDSHYRELCLGLAP